MARPGVSLRTVSLYPAPIHHPVGLFLAAFQMLSYAGPHCSWPPEHQCRSWLISTSVIPSTILLTRTGGLYSFPAQMHLGRLSRSGFRRLPVLNCISWWDAEPPKKPWQWVFAAQPMCGLSPTLPCSLLSAAKLKPAQLEATHNLSCAHATLFSRLGGRRG